jgi:hypothetical protein
VPHQLRAGRVVEFDIGGAEVLGGAATLLTIARPSG